MTRRTSILPLVIVSGVVLVLVLLLFNSSLLNAVTEVVNRNVGTPQKVNKGPDTELLVLVIAGGKTEKKKQKEKKKHTSHILSFKARRSLIQSFGRIGAPSLIGFTT